MDKIHKKLEKTLVDNLKSDETVHVKLAGRAGKEALVCTNRRVMILKTGFYSGGGLGYNQFLYSKITSADVKVGFLGAYFELGLGGNQNKQLPLFTEAMNLPNCVTLDNKKDAAKFRDACNFIIEHIEVASQPQIIHVPVVTTASPNESQVTVKTEQDEIFETIEKLASLKEKNIITEDEFEAKKKELLARI